MSEFVGLLSVIIGIASWFFPDISIEVKIIITLSSIILGLIIVIILLKIKLKKPSPIEKKHEALAREFENKQKENQLYIEALWYTYNIININFSKLEQEYFINTMNCIKTYIENAFNKTRWFK